MCGIAGIFNTNGEAVSQSILKKMADNLQHRGPDNTSIETKGAVGVIHTRLSLLDLSANGNQPFSNGRYTLVYNGEIYNFKVLREKVQRSYNVNFISSSDTEVLFHLLVHEGTEKTLKQIEGMFAFAFFDHKDQVMRFARDRIGIKPFFYHHGTYGVSFASELKALSSTLDLTLDYPRVVQSVFGYLEHSRGYSAFEDTYQVEPGTWMEIRSNGSISTHTYFNTSELLDKDYYNELDNMSSSDVLNVFDQLFRDSVNKMLVADAPIGAFVSGGIDSSLISTVAKQCGKNPNLYTVNVMGCFSELDFARILAESLDTQLNVFDFSPEMFIRDWVKTTWHNDAPVVINQHAVPFGNITRVAREKNDKAVLTGEGADELFLGYPRHVRARMENAMMMPLKAMEAVYNLVPGLNVNQRSEKNSFSSQLHLMSMQYENDTEESLYNDSVSFISSRHLRNMQRISLKLIDTTLYSLLWRNDRMGMLNSIESRFPFLDEAILKFACSLPLKHKIRKTFRFEDVRHPFMVDKYLVRKLASKTLPRKLTAKRKQAFPIHGLNNVKVNCEYFNDGFWQDVMKLSDKNIKHMCKSTTPLLLAKLASVETWGRLFHRNESLSSVESALQANTSISV